MDGPCCQAFVFDSVGAGEWLVLAVVILVVFGPRRLPELARKIGRALEQLRHTADQFRDQLMTLDQTEQESPPPGAGAPDGADRMTQAGAASAETSDRHTRRLGPDSPSRADPAPADSTPAAATPASFAASGAERHDPGEPLPPVPSGGAT